MIIIVWNETILYANNSSENILNLKKILINPIPEIYFKMYNILGPCEEGWIYNLDSSIFLIIILNLKKNIFSFKTEVLC